MFKVNNKDTRTYFTLCSSVSIVNFEHVIASLEKLEEYVFHSITEKEVIQYILSLFPYLFHKKTN